MPTELSVILNVWDLFPSRLKPCKIDTLFKIPHCKAWLQNEVITLVCLDMWICFVF